MKLVTDTKKVELYHWCIGDGLRRGNFFQVGNAAWIHWLHTAVFTGHSTILADELSLCWAVLSYLKFYLPLMSPGISLCPLLQWAPAGTHHTQHNLPYASELQKHFLHMQMTAVVYVAQRSNESLSLISSEAPRGGSAHPALGCPAGAVWQAALHSLCDQGREAGNSGKRVVRLSPWGMFFRTLIYLCPGSWFSSVTISRRDEDAAKQGLHVTSPWAVSAARVVSKAVKDHPWGL